LPGSLSTTSACIGQLYETGGIVGFAAAWPNGSTTRESSAPRAADPMHEVRKPRRVSMCDSVTHPGRCSTLPDARATNRTSKVRPLTRRRQGSRRPYDLRLPTVDDEPLALEPIEFLKGLEAGVRHPLLDLIFGDHQCWLVLMRAVGRQLHDRDTSIRL